MRLLTLLLLASAAAPPPPRRDPERDDPPEPPDIEPPRSWAEFDELAHPIGEAMLRERAKQPQRPPQGAGLRSMRPWDKARPVLEAAGWPPVAIDALEQAGVEPPVLRSTLRELAHRFDQLRFTSSDDAWMAYGYAAGELEDLCDS